MEDDGLNQNGGEESGISSKRRDGSSEWRVHRVEESWGCALTTWVMDEVRMMTRTRDSCVDCGVYGAGSLI